MKKIIFSLVMFLILPFMVSASDNIITKYYIDYNILANGDVEVTDLIAYNGSFNGYYVDVAINDNASLIFDGSEDAFRYSQIYSPTSFELTAVMEIPYASNMSFDSVNNYGIDFNEVTSASEGDYGVYTVTEVNNVYTIKMYNPAVYETKVFLVKYILKNAAVVHNDVAEVYLKVFDAGFGEYIDDLEIKVHSDNAPIERVWAHGPLTGESAIVGTDAVITNSKIDMNTLMDFRVVISPFAVYNSLKKTNIDALDSIIALETKLADEANIAREDARMVTTITYIFLISYIGFLVVTVYHAYNKYDKELPDTLKVKYYRDFPDTYGPEIVAHLFNKPIDGKTLSSSLMNLIERKVIKYEEIKKDEFMFKLGKNDEFMVPSEELLLKWFFVTIGKNDMVTMKQINDYAKKEYIAFAATFKLWSKAVKAQADGYNFFAPKPIKTMVAEVTIISIAIAILYFWQSPEGGFFIFISIMVLGYLTSASKRTADGNMAYLKWKGLSNFIGDFGYFTERDLPHVELWGKYLVYALAFGKADKLAKTMKVKFTEMGQSPDNMVVIDHFTGLMIMNSVISSGINTAYQQSVSRVASSSNSSGGGFGGGFSSGGGGGGGHGGGGF